MSSFITRDKVSRKGGGEEEEEKEEKNLAETVSIRP